MWTLVVIAAISLLGQVSQQYKIDAEGCGQRPLAPTARVATRIIGGHVSTPYSWPFMCTIEDQQLHSLICAGSLIKSRTGKYFIITAAHCISHLGTNVARIKSRCSIHNVLSHDPSAVDMPLSGAVIHPNFNQDFHFDMGLLQVSGDVNLTDSLQPVCLPTVPHQQYEMATVLGWGHTVETGGTGSPELREGRKPIVSDAQCATAYGVAFTPNSMLCAGYIEQGGADACVMDSGGPLLAERNGSYELVGLVSWGYGCGLPQYPGVYGDVYDMIQWLDMTINTMD